MKSTLTCSLQLILFIIICIPACKKESIAPNVPSIGFQKTYGGNADDYAYSGVFLNGELYVVGTTKSQSDPNGDIYLLKLDLEGNIIFERYYGGLSEEEGYNIITTSDGNLMIIGSTQSQGAGMKDVYILKIDTKGNVLWESVYGGSLDDIPSDIIETAHVGFCLLGTTESFGNGSRDIYLLWLDPNGNKIREKYYGGADFDGGSEIMESGQDDLLIYGYTRNYGAVGGICIY